MKIDVRIVYGKNELQPEEINWLKELSFVRTSFCKNLHAKCYINEESCIITSLNLYEFSQVNNNEMGVLFSRADDTEMYREAYDEAQRIIRISDEIRMSLEKVNKEPAADTGPSDQGGANGEGKDLEKLTTSKLAKQMNLRTAELIEKLVATGHLEDRDGKPYITDKGKAAGGECGLPRF